MPRLSGSLPRYQQFRQESVRFVPVLYQWYSTFVDKAKAKLFFNGRSQAVRLPAAFRFEGTEVYIRKDAATGDVILSAKPNTWDEFLALRDLHDPDIRDFLKDRDTAPPQTRDLF